MAINGNSAAVHIVKPRNQVGNSGLAAAAWPHQGNHLPRLRLEGNVLQGRLSFLVGEGDVLELHLSLDRGQRLCPWHISNLLVQIHDLKYAISCRHSLLDGSIDTGKPLHRVGQVHRIGQERHQLTGGNHLVDHLVAAEPDDKGNGNSRQKLHRRRQQAAELHILHGSLEIPPVLLLKPPDFVCFTDKGLHHPDGGDAFLQKGGNLCRPLLNHRAGTLQLAAKNLHGKAHQWDGHQSQETQLPVQVNHHAQGAYQDGALRHQLNEIVHNGALHGRHIIGDVAHNRAGLLPVIVGQRHLLEFPEQHAAHIDDDPLPHIGHQIALPVVEHATGEHDHQNACRNQVQHQHILGHEHIVNHVLDNPRQVKIGTGRHNNAHHRSCQTLLVWFYISQ